MSVVSTTIGPLPHSEGDWDAAIAAGAGYNLNSQVFHRGSSYRSLVDANHVEPSFTYNSATGEYTCSEGWGLVAVGAGADVVQEMAQISELKDGTLIPLLSENLKGLASRDEQSVPDVMADWIQSAGGDESIDSTKGCSIEKIVPTLDFAANKFISSGKNLLRLQTNNGLAINLGSGYAFPVPMLVATNASIGTANENNGVLFTDSEGNMLTPTVYFKAGHTAPASVSDYDGAATYIDKNGRRHFTTPSAGWLIVIGITWATTCAHLGWSGSGLVPYNFYVSPTDSNDAGTIVDLSVLGTMRVIGSGANIIYDQAVKTSASAMQLQTKVGRAQPTWTRGALDAETGLYPYTAALAGGSGQPAAILSGGIAEFEGSGKPVITVNGTTLTYYSESATALTDYVKYQLASPTTASKSVNSEPSTEDWGIQALIGVSGTAQIEIEYSQGWPDTLAALPSKTAIRDQVLAEAIVLCATRLKALENALISSPNRMDIFVKTLDAEDIRILGVPQVLEFTGADNTTAVTPAAARIPDNWEQDTMGVWQGVPRKIGQVWIGRSLNGSSKIAVAVAKAVTGSVDDWVVIYSV